MWPARSPGSSRYKPKVACILQPCAVCLRLHTPKKILTFQGGDAEAFLRLRAANLSFTHQASACRSLFQREMAATTTSSTVEMRGDLDRSWWQQQTYLQELDVSARAPHLVDAFKKNRVRDFHIVHVSVEYFYAVHPVPPHYLKHYLVEELLEGMWRSSTATQAGSFTCLTGVGELERAFSHFTYYASHGSQILVYVQGLVKDNQFYLHDVARHTKEKPSSLEPMNHGRKGIMSFFRSHKCRSM